MKRFQWWQYQLRPNASPALGRVRRFEFLEARFCYSADGISTDFLTDPIVDIVEISTVVITRDETQADPSVTDENRDGEDVDQHFPGEDIPGDEVNSCTDIEIDVSPEHRTVCGFLASHSDAGLQSELVSKAASDLQGDEPNEPIKDPVPPVAVAPSGLGSSGPGSSGLGSSGAGSSLHPIEQLNVDPIVVASMPNQPIVIFRTMDSSSPSVGQISTKLKTSQGVNSTKVAKLSPSPIGAAFPSIAFKQSIHKQTVLQGAVDLRPQVSAIPTIMPGPIKVKTLAGETLEAQIVLDRSAAAELPVIEMPTDEMPSTEIELGVGRMVTKEGGLSDALPTENPVAGKPEDNSNQRQLWVGAIIVGWIATPRRAMARLAGNMQAQLVSFSLRLFPRDKSIPGRPMLLEEADE